MKANTPKAMPAFGQLERTPINNTIQIGIITGTGILQTGKEKQRYFLTVSLLTLQLQLQSGHDDDEECREARADAVERAS